MPQNKNEPLSVDLNVLRHESEQDYHAKVDEYLSSHRLMDFMQCPWLYRKKQLGLVEEKETPSYLIGRAAHVRILEGRGRYEQTFALGGPINERTGKPYGSDTKAFAEWQQAQGKPVLSHDQVELIENLAAGVAMNAQVVDLLLYGQAEGVLRGEYCGVPCQIRLDWVSPHQGLIDLKTTDHLDYFESDARRFRYIHQMGFYQAVFEQVVSQRLPVQMIGIEKREPYRCGLWRVDENSLNVARRENEAAIARLVRCRNEDHWPTGFEQPRVLSFC